MNAVHLDLRRYYGATLTRLVIGEFQIQFEFVGPGINISIEGEWLLTDQEGEVIDRSLPHWERDNFCLARLLGRRMQSTIAAPKAFTVHFNNGWTLSMFDRFEHRDSFHIEPGDIFG